MSEKDESAEKKIENLRWVRVFTPTHIPKYLVEQLKDREYPVNDFYSYQEGICLIKSEDGMKLNPMSHLYVLADQDNLVKGFVWFTIDELNKDIVIQNYSMDKEYWGGGRAVNKLANFIKDIRIKAGLNKIYWVCRYPKHSERYGFKRSKHVIMEYDGKEDGKNNEGGHNHKQCATTNS